MSRLRRAVELYREEGAGRLARAAGTQAWRHVRALPLWLKAYRVRRRKAAMADADAAYTHDPRVSILIQSFNRRETIDDIAPHLPDDPEYETVVCEDGSLDGSLEAWDRRLTRRNDFLVRSNDLHEIRAYTRAIGLSRGEYVCLLQDDDALPESHDWLEGALALFEAHPDLHVVCGQSAWGLQDLDPDYRFAPDGSVTGCHPEIEGWLREGGGFHDRDPGTVPTRDPATGRRFVYTPCISVGPVVLRRETFEELGGFDLEFSEPGEPGMGFEVDFGLRCWRAGYRVGFTPMGFDRGDLGGTELYGGQDERDRARETAWARLREKHREHFDDIADRVHAASAELVAVESGGDG